MPEFCLPILGFGSDDTHSYTVTWRDGQVVYRGLLGDIEELIAQRKEREAEEVNNQQLRNSGVAVLDDWRQND